MNVSCPSCRARYRVSDDKIKGRGAKITCPKCAHRFVVYRHEEDAPDVGSLDFRTLGLTWRASRGVGLVHEFHDLDGLRELMGDGRVDHNFRISVDGHNWTPLDAVPDLDAFFHGKWQGAKRGEIKAMMPARPEEDDEADAPTMIAGRGSSLASEIRQAVNAEATPAPADTRNQAESQAPQSTGHPMPAPPDTGSPLGEPPPNSGPRLGESIDPAPLDPTPIHVPRAEQPPQTVRPPSVPAPSGRRGCSSLLGFGAAILFAAWSYLS